MMELIGVALLRAILPDEFSEQLRLIATNWKRDKFALGDIRNSLKAMVDERLLPIATPDIDDFLSECVNHEIEPRTIRYYAMIAYAFPEPVRSEYAMLPHSHFALAQSYGEKSKLVLDLAKDRELVSGKVPSAAWLRAALSGYIYEQASGAFPTNDMPEPLTCYDEAAILCDDTTAPEGVKAAGWLTSLHRAVQFSINHIDAVPMESSLRMKLLDLLAQVDSLLGSYIIME